MHTLYQWIEKKRIDMSTQHYKIYSNGEIDEKKSTHFIHNKIVDNLIASLPEITDTMKNELIALVGEDEELDFENKLMPSPRDLERNARNQEKSRLRTAINNYFKKRV